MALRKALMLEDSGINLDNAHIRVTLLNINFGTGVASIRVLVYKDKAAFDAGMAPAFVRDEEASGAAAATFIDGLQTKIETALLNKPYYAGAVIE